MLLEKARAAGVVRARRMAESAAHLINQAIPRVPVRQGVPGRRC